MKVLLDTHTLIWAAVTATMLSETAAATIAHAETTVFVSAASAWEISTKVRLGKLPVADRLESIFLEAMDRAGYTLLPIYAEDALRAGRMAGVHRDPFDRMIAAQALTMDIPVVSVDAKLDAFGIRRIW